MPECILTEIRTDRIHVEGAYIPVQGCCCPRVAGQMLVIAYDFVVARHRTCCTVLVVGSLQLLLVLLLLRVAMCGNVYTTYRHFRKRDMFEMRRGEGNNQQIIAACGESIECGCGPHTPRDREREREERECASIINYILCRIMKIMQIFRMTFAAHNSCECLIFVGCQFIRFISLSVYHGF